MSKTLLSVENLHVYYGGIHALKGVSLNLEEGEIVTLIGSNGAGKSTLLRAISGLESAKEGRIMYRNPRHSEPSSLRAKRGNLIRHPERSEGTDLTKTQPHNIVAKGVSHVPEGRIIFANLTVKENLDVGAYIRSDKGGIKSDLEKMYSLFPILKERTKQIAGTLSGGEQQMLAIARALMARPKLLLLDEPSLGIAPVIVRNIFKTLKDINRDGTTILLVEQNAHMALSIANRGYVLETGSIVLTGKASELITHEGVKKAYLGG